MTYPIYRVVQPPGVIRWPALGSASGPVGPGTHARFLRWNIATPQRPFIVWNSYGDATPVPVLVVDTHDGVKRRRKFREANERLRYMIQHAFDPQAYPLPIVEEVRELAEPAVETLESGRKQIDLQAIEGRVREALLAKYEAFVAERQRMEQDDELVLYADA